MNETTAPPVIQATTNYNRFHLLKENRIVNGRLIAKMVMSVTEGKNFLPFYPIIVGADDGVRDGQHRLAAARTCDVPIYFIVSDEIDVRDIAALNAATMKWTLVDYLNYWATLGVEPYIKLIELMDEYPDLRVTAAMRISSSEGTRGSRYVHFKAGTWMYDDSGIPERTVLAVASIEKLWIDAWRRSSVLAIMEMVKHDRFDPERFVEKVAANNGLLSRHPRWEDVLRVYQTVYNYKARGSTRINFLASRFFL